MRPLFALMVGVSLAGCGVNPVEDSVEFSATAQLTNASTGESFTSNPLYPYSVPAPGSCTTTGGMTCGLIGDKYCEAAIDVTGKVDPVYSVTEASESNNTLTVGF